MTPIHTDLFILVAGGLWPHSLPDAHRLRDTLERQAWVRSSSWVPYTQAMPYVPHQPHWSWVWSEVVNNQIPFGLSPYTWLAMGGPRVADFLYEVVPFVLDKPETVSAMPAWDALRLEAQKQGAVAMLLNGHVFWRFKSPLEGVWAPSLAGEASSPYLAWEEEALQALKVHMPEVTSVRLMPGGQLTRLKTTGWRAVYSNDIALRGLTSRLGVPTQNITDSLERFATTPRAPGQALIMDTRLLHEHDWDKWCTQFDTLHHDIGEAIERIKPASITWLLSGVKNVLSLTPQAPSLWPWLRTPEPLDANLFTESDPNL